MSPGSSAPASRSGEPPRRFPAARRGGPHRAHRRACTTCSGPSRPAGRQTVARFAALVEGAGYGLTITPILEHAGVFLRGIGEGSEVVGKEMYVFEDRDGQMMALRPEGTAPIARAYVQHHPVPPWKAWYVAPSFRHENPQHGRYRQHHQLGRGGARAGRRRPRRRGRLAGPRLLRRPRAAPGDLEAALHGRRRLPAGVHRVAECLPGRAGRPAVPGPPRAAPREPAAGARLQVRGMPGRHRRRAALLGPPVRPVPRALRPGAGGARSRSAWRTSSTTASCGASTTTRAPRSSSRRTPWTRRRTASAAAAATTAWSSCWAATPRPASGSASGWSGCCWPVTPRVCSALESALAAHPLHAYVIDTAGGESAVALTAELRRAGLRADRAFDGRSMKSQIKSADRSGALVALVVGDRRSWRRAPSACGPCAARPASAACRGLPLWRSSRLSWPSRSRTDPERDDQGARKPAPAGSTGSTPNPHPHPYPAALHPPCPHRPD